MRKFILGASVAIVFVACKSNQKQAFEYNNFINSINASYSTHINASRAQMQILKSTGKYAEFSAACASTRKMIDSLVTVVDKESAPGSASDLKKKMIDYLKFESRVYGEVQDLFGKLTDQTTQEEVIKIEEKFAAVVKEEVMMANDLQKTQNEFIEKSNMKAVSY
jgi:hypothetical protein